MSQTFSPDWIPVKGRRRSLRVLLTIPIIISGKGAGGKDFQEQTNTLVVNAHGALALLSSRVAQGQSLTIANKATDQKLSCRVVFLGPTQGGKTQVGLEFTQPSPGFWRIDFPPDDWKVPED
jgi:hypothetical protein